jgi:hypothetical protein
LPDSKIAETQKVAAFSTFVKAFAGHQGSVAHEVTPTRHVEVSGITGSPQQRTKKPGA